MFLTKPGIPFDPKYNSQNSVSVVPSARSQSRNKNLQPIEPCSKRTEDNETKQEGGKTVAEGVKTEGGV